MPFCFLSNTIFQEWLFFLTCVQVHSIACHDARSDSNDSLLYLDLALLRTTPAGCNCFKESSIKAACAYWLQSLLRLFWRQKDDQRRKVLTDLSEGRRQRRQLQLENCTSAEIEEILKVVQHKSLRQVEQEALKAFGDDKERALVTLK